MPSLLHKNWILRGEKKPNESLAKATKRIRKWEDDFLKPAQITDLKNAAPLHDMKTAIARITRAIKTKEKIFLFGDFDLDGASGIAILYLGLKYLGATVFPYLPSRSEGYGLSQLAYEKAKTKGATLVITTDCGSSNAAEVAFGKSIDIETIITDHHSLPKILPEAVAIVHPHLGKKEDNTWELTGAGVAFFVIKKLFRAFYPEKNINALLEQMLELAVLGTVADVGVLRQQNRVITHLGLEKMKRTHHPGLRALFHYSKTDPETLTAESIAFFLAPRLNAAGRVAHPNAALRVLLGDAKAAEELEDYNSQRREITAELCAVAEAHIDESAPCFVVFHEDFFSGVAGLIAAHLAEKWEKPAVVLSPSNDPDLFTASCRGPEDFHLANALQKLAPLLHTFGGHACAAGFSIPRKNIEKFETQFSALVKKKRGENPPAPTLFADCQSEVDDFFLPDFEDIFLAAPFGEGNPAPTFVVTGKRMHTPKLLGTDNAHLRFSLSGNFGKVGCIAFRFGSLLSPKIWGEKFDFLVAPTFSVWKKQRRLQLRVVDIRRAEKIS